MLARMIDLPIVRDSRGNLTFVEAHRQIPFGISRVYYLYDVPSGETRGGHAHHDLHQLLVPLSGSFSVVVDDGASTESFTLNRPFRGLHLPPLHWRELVDFSAGAVCLVIASEEYDESDYIRDHAAFLSLVAK